MYKENCLAKMDATLIKCCGRQFSQPVHQKMQRVGFETVDI